MDLYKKKYYMALSIAVARLLQYFNRSDVECGETFFSDHNGIYFEGDIGYLLEGLIALSDSLDKILGE